VRDSCVVIMRFDRHNDAETSLSVCLSVCLCVSASMTDYICVRMSSYMGGTNFWGGTKENDVSFIRIQVCFNVYDKY